MGRGRGAVVALRVLLFKNAFLAGNVALSCSEFSGQPHAQTPPGWVFGWPGGPEFAPLPPCRKRKCVVEGGFTQSSGWMGWCSGQEGGRLRHWHWGAGESPVCLREDLWADVGPGEPRDGPRGEEASGEPGACQPALLPSPPGHLMAPRARAALAPWLGSSAGQLCSAESSLWCGATAGAPSPPRSARVPGSWLLTRAHLCVSPGHSPPRSLLSGGRAPSGTEAPGGLWHHLLRLPQRERPLPLPGQQQPLPLSGRGQERLHGEPWSLAGGRAGGQATSRPPEPDLCVPRCPP